MSISKLRVSPQVITTSIVIIILSGIYVYGLGEYLANDDEGTFLYQAWRVYEGDQIYQDFYSSRWPLFIYTGTFWLRLFGFSVVPFRLISILLTAGTAFLVYLTTKRFTGHLESIVAVVVYLINPIVFDNSRFYATEPYYIFFGLLGFYTFLLTYKRPSPWALLIPGMIFPISAMYKVLGHLIAAGCVAFLSVEWLKQPGNRKGLTQRIFIFGLTHALLYIAYVGAVALLFPTFTEGVLGANFGDDPTSQFSLADNLSGWFVLVIHYLVIHFPICFVALVEYFPARRENREVAAVGWQIPTLLSFILLSRTLFIRLFVYINPFLAILFGIAIGRLLQRNRFHPIAFISISLVFVIGFFSWPTQLYRHDEGTRTIIAEIEALSSPEDIVFSDYQEFNFLAQRASTFQGAEISSVIIQNGIISGEAIIDELESNGADLVILDRDGSHLSSLEDLDLLDTFLSEHYQLNQTVDRSTRFNEEETHSIEFWVKPTN